MTTPTQTATLARINFLCPVCSTLFAMALRPEQDPKFAGIYEGACPECGNTFGCYTQDPLMSSDTYKQWSEAR